MNTNIMDRLGAASLGKCAAANMDALKNTLGRAKGAVKDYWGNLSGETYRAAKASPKFVAKNHKMVTNHGEALKKMHLARAGTGAALLAGGGAYALSRGKNEKTASIVGDYLVGGIPGAVAGRLTPEEANELRGYHGLAPKGGVRTRAFGKAMGTWATGTGAGAAIGAGIGAMAKKRLGAGAGAAIGASLGSFAGGVAGIAGAANKYSRRGLEKQRELHGVKTAEDYGYGIAPFRTSPDEDYNSAKNYFKEYGNRAVGSAAHGLAGAVPGGLLVAGGALAGKPRLVLGGGILSMLGAVAGTYAGDLTSLRKTERMSGRKPTSAGQYAGRVIGGALGGTAIPLAGQGIADYYVSRKMQNH